MAEGDGCGGPAWRVSGQDARPDGAILPVVGGLGGPGGTDLHAVLVEGQLQHPGGRPLLGVVAADLGPAAGHQVLTDDPQRVLGELGRDRSDPAGDHGAAVVHRAVEQRPGEDQSVEMGDGRAHRDAVVAGVEEQAPAGRPVQEHPAALAQIAHAIGKRQHDGPAVPNHRDVRHQAGPQDLLERLRIVVLPVAEASYGQRRRRAGHSDNVVRSPDGKPRLSDGSEPRSRRRNSSTL